MARTPDKVREIRLRRMADRQGLVLQKSRARDPRALTFEGFQLVDEETKRVVVGIGNKGRNYAADLDAIEAYLTGARRDQAA